MPEGSNLYIYTIRHYLFREQELFHVVLTCIESRYSLFNNICHISALLLCYAAMLKPKLHRHTMKLCLDPKPGSVLYVHMSIGQPSIIAEPRAAQDSSL